MEQQKLVKVSVEVRSGTLQGRRPGRKHSAGVEHGGRRYPRGEVRVAFPIEPEGFFVGGHRPWRGSRKEKIGVRRSGF